MGGMIGEGRARLHTSGRTERISAGMWSQRRSLTQWGVLEVNASMGLIVAAPTAGSSGVIPGVFCSLQENFGFTDEEICKVLFNAAAVGYLITKCNNGRSGGRLSGGGRSGECDGGVRGRGASRRNSGTVSRCGILCDREYFRTRL